MNKLLLTAGGVLTALPLGAAGPEPKSAPKNRPNVLFIAVDDLKPVLGCYGDTYAHSPNIDALAAISTVYEHCYCQQAVSAATRASLLTGVRPDSTKVWDLKTLIRDKNPDILTLPQHFAAQGYETAGIGKIYDSRSVDKQQDAVSWTLPYLRNRNYMDPEYARMAVNGYIDPEFTSKARSVRKEGVQQGLKGKELDRYMSRNGLKPSTECIDAPDDAYADGGTAKGAIEYLRNGRPKDRPFFLAVGFVKPHLPFTAPKRYWELYRREDAPLAPFRLRAQGSPDYGNHPSGELKQYTDIPAVYEYSDVTNTVLPDEKQQELIHGYYAAMSYTDAQIGKVLDALREEGLDGNTVIVLWGDHGWHLGDHGLWNKHSDFENATRVPFLIHIPGVAPGRVQGPVEFLDIFPTLCEAAGIKVPKGLDGTSLLPSIRSGKEPGLEIAVSQWPGRHGSMGYSLRTARYRYTVWVDWKGRRLDSGHVLAEELYDYEADPLEKENLIERPEYSEAAARMRVHWQQYRKKYRLR